MDYSTVKTYSGKWKLDGYDSNYRTFRDGLFDLLCDNAVWRCQLRLNCDPTRVLQTYQLTNKIKEVITGKRIILELKDGKNIHFDTDKPEQDDLAKKLSFIKSNRLLVPSGERNSRTPQGKQSASTTSRSTPQQIKRTSPKSQFTGVKMKDESLDEDMENDSQSPPLDISRKEASENFLAKGQMKAVDIVSAGSFYGKSSAATTYSSSYPSHRSMSIRRPGLIPDPSPRSRLTGLSPTFSWLQRTPVSGKSQPKNLQGFSNLGNTCYMNAILQAIYGLDMFTSDLIESANRVNKLLDADHKTSLIHGLHNLFMAKKSNSSTEQKRHLLAEVKKNISSSAKRFSGFEQHDAHEFLGQVLDQLKEEMDKINKQISVKSEGIRNTSDILEQQDKNPSASNFEFKINHTITCSNCGSTVNNLETFNDMSVDIPPTRALEATWSIQDALDLTFLPEEVDYTCEKCEGKEAKVQHKFSKLPRVLILHLKRYSFNTLTSRNTKLGQSLIVPKFLTLKSQCTEETTPSLPAPEAPEVLVNTAKFNFVQSKAKSGNNTPKRRLNLDGNDSKEPERDTSLRKAVESSSRPSLKVGPQRVLRTDQETSTDTSPIPLPAPTSTKYSKESYIPDESMSEEDMMKMAMERSMQEVDTPQKHVNFMTQTQKSSPITINRQNTPLRGGRSSSESPGVMNSVSDSPLNKSYSENGVGSQTSTDHNYVAQEPGESIDTSPGCEGQLSSSATRRGLHLEPPYKRTKLDECDSAYNSFTEIEDRGAAKEDRGVAKEDRGIAKEDRGVAKEDRSITKEDRGVAKEESPSCKGKPVSTRTSLQNGNATQTELNSSGVDLNISDEENKENYTPPTAYSPSQGQEPGVEPLHIKEEATAESIKLSPEEGYDEETQLRMAIENSLKDLESMDIQQDLDDDLEKAKQLSLQDVENDVQSYVITPQRPKDKRDLKRSKSEEQALKEHAENGELPYSYQLVGIVSHIGQSSASGHYISDTYDMNERKWYTWNDSHGQVINWEEIRRERERTGYIFFYVAKEVVDDMENQYYRKRSRVRSLSVGAIPAKLISDLPEKPASTVKLGFLNNKRLELR